ncbi:MAG TPA: BON domain-containing protein [Chitinophagaceae bacterium]|nr:BON domain-containing protein [Chitinophagaceae bacterium]
MKILKSTLAIALITSVVLVGCKPKDADIQANIEKNLQTMPGISVTVKDGVATFTGECQNEASKDSVVNAAKDIKGVKSVVNNCTVAPPPPPVTVDTTAATDALTQGVADATKDFPGVKATVADGVITLTGDIKRSDLARLMMSLNSLKPKKIENKLTIK